MNINRYTYAIITLLILALAPPAAAEQFMIHSGSDAISARESAPRATLSISPYDDAVLEDGFSHYYLVRNEDGEQVGISVHKNSLLGAVRIAFDDGNPSAAPVDPSQSSVLLSPASLPADGISMAQILIVPRDADAVPLGSGLNIQIDLEALFPGFLCGSLVDRGDGSYLYSVVSALPGSGRIWISVEGIPLENAPTLTFEYAGGPSDLRELARQNLEAMTMFGGPFDAILTGVDPLDPGAERVLAAWELATAGLELLYAESYDQDHEVVGLHLSAAIDELAAALDEPGELETATIVAVLDELLDVGNLIARFHFNRAQDSCGACDPAEGGQLCAAEQALYKGDAERTAADTDHVKALRWYAKAVEKALDARARCAG
jgi:hypothetical protein